MQCLEKKELIRVYFVLTLVLILLLLLLGLLLAYVICPWICYELQRGDPGRQDHEPGPGTFTLPRTGIHTGAVATISGYTGEPGTLGGGAAETKKTIFIYVTPEG